MIKLKDILLEYYSDKEQEYIETIYDVESDVFNNFINSKKGDTQKWKVVPLNRMKKIWDDFSKRGVVHDERGLDNILDQIGYNILQLRVNTVLSGHTAEDPQEKFEEYGLNTEKKQERFYDYITDPKTGQLMITDYGLNKLFPLFFKALKEESYEEKLILIDKMLNVIHQRGDLAAFFIEGGSKSLNILGGYDD